MTERELQAAVIDLAHVMGWRVAHFRPALDSHGRWKTAVAADGAGFPDLVMLRGARQLVVELKSVGRFPDAKQTDWLDAFDDAGALTQVWTPEQWENGHIIDVLKRVPVTV